jgi:pilus assembly protein CpaB
MSAGQNYQKDAEGKPVLVQVVNLLVTPQQAEILNLATDQKLMLVLRNPADHAIVQTPGAVTASLFQGGAPRPPRPMTRRPDAAPSPTPIAPPSFLLNPAPAPPKPFTIEVFAGNRKSEATFPTPAPGVHQ